MRARILLEDPGIGCIASFDDGLNVILCRFTKAEHSLILPLWQPSASSQKLFGNLAKWHQEQFDDARLSGEHTAVEKNWGRGGW